jgi:hypothetical protein
MHGFAGKHLKEVDLGVVLGTDEGIILKLLLNMFGRYELASSGLAQGLWRAVVTMVMILQVPEIHGTSSWLKNCSLFQDSAPLRHVISYIVSHQYVCLSVCLSVCHFSFLRIDSKILNWFLYGDLP